jgi:hypothetical protein
MFSAWFLPASLRHVARDLQAQEVQPLVVHQLGKKELTPNSSAAAYLLHSFCHRIPLHDITSGVCVDQICIILGVILMILSPIGGLRQIIMDAKTYQFYS